MQVEIFIKKTEHGIVIIVLTSGVVNNMKTPKEKAKELTWKFMPHAEECYPEGSIARQRDLVCAKEHASICTDEIVSLWNPDDPVDIQYWQQVKTEIENQ